MEYVYEQSRLKLEELVEWYKLNKGSRNEATTRLHLIDGLLKQCLDWKIDDITAEDQYLDEYTDYTLKTDRPILILEAKKEGIYFELPAGFKRQKYSLKSLCRDNKDLEKALNQVSGYCQKRGVEIGVVSNGWQLVAFIANRTDGIPPLSGQAFVFSSLENMLQNFKQFWNLLSKKGIEERNIFREIIGETMPDLPLKLSSVVATFPGTKDRNIYQTDLQIISDIVLEDVVKDKSIEKDFLKECYCKSGALSQYALISKDILKTRHDYFQKSELKGHVDTVSNKKGINGEFSELFINSLSRRPILLVGDVGVGKSTFINNLIKVEAESIFKKSISLIIDLGSQAVLTSDIKSAVIDEIYNQLLENYNIDLEENGFVRATYHLELERLKGGINKPLYEKNDPRVIDKEIEFLGEKLVNKNEHIRKSLVHLSGGRKQQIVIFIDNCDQRDDATQQEAFLIAQEIAEHWPVTVFVSLRPQTFHQSVREGALSGYHPKVFTIPPPRISEVINKRLSFAQKITRGEISLSNVHGGAVELKLKKLDSLIEVLKYSFDNNEKLLEFIDNISNGNIRQAIDLVKNFLGSGHVDTAKIVGIYEESGEYLIPLHEFLRAVLYGDNIYYDTNSSLLANLFNIGSLDKKEHFILPILLGILHSNLNSGKDNGFIESIEVKQQLQSTGFTMKQIEQCLMAANKKKLIENSTRDNCSTMIRITTVGIYHIRFLCTIFTYFDAVIVDTAILDEDIRSEIHDEFAISGRLKRAEIFRQYLDEAWLTIHDKNAFFNWPEKSKNLENEIEKIRKEISQKI